MNDELCGFKDLSRCSSCVIYNVRMCLHRLLKLQGFGFGFCSAVEVVRLPGNCLNFGAESTLVQQRLSF